MNVTDNASRGTSDTFAITFSNGYAVRRTLISGDIRTYQENSETRYPSAAAADMITLLLIGGGTSHPISTAFFARHPSRNRLGSIPVKSRSFSRIPTILPSRSVGYAAAEAALGRRMSTVGLPGVLALLVATLVLNSLAPASLASSQFTWMATGSLVQSREQHTATLLPDGRVLVAGGFGNVIPLATAELYDPATGLWSLTGRLVKGRYGHSATLLPNGKVLVAGGTDVTTVLSEAELYDPATGVWTPTASMNSARKDHTATLLSDGRVLVAGGWADDVLASSEIYDPATETWTETGDLNQAREFHEATLLANGNVLLVCGVGKNGSGYYELQSAEIYTVASGTWSFTGELSTIRASTTLTLLANGRALVSGGLASSRYGLKTAEAYNPSAGVWSPTGSMKTPREAHTATALPDRTVLVTGGVSDTRALRTTEVYDPRAQTWTTVGQLVTGRFFHSATLLLNGTVLVAGGRSKTGQETRTAEIGMPAASAQQ